jgi:hypothetical protein
MKWISVTIHLTLCLLVTAGMAMAGEGIEIDQPQSAVWHSTGKKTATECVILNRTNPNFEQEFRKVHAENCVLVIGSWKIKTDYHLRPAEISSPDQQTSEVAWKDLKRERTWLLGKKIDLPVIQVMQWKLRLRLHGVQRVTADMSYGF